MLMLTKAFKAKWLAALRGGLYKKGIGQLRNRKNQCCCLGVAGDLLVAEGRAKWQQPVPPAVNWEANWILCANDDAGRWATRSSRMSLPEPLRRLIGLSNDVQRQLINANDTHRTFKQAIEILEALPTKD